MMGDKIKHYLKGVVIGAFGAIVIFGRFAGVTTDGVPLFFYYLPLYAGAGAVFGLIIAHGLQLRNRKDGGRSKKLFWGIILMTVLVYGYMPANQAVWRWMHTVEIGGVPGTLEWDGELVWVELFDTVEAVDPESGEVVWTVAVGYSPRHLVWVSNRDSLMAINPETGKLVQIRP